MNEGNKKNKMKFNLKVVVPVTGIRVDIGIMVDICMVQFSGSSLLSPQSFIPLQTAVAGTQLVLLQWNASYQHPSTTVDSNNSIYAALKLAISNLQQFISSVPG